MLSPYFFVETRNAPTCKTRNLGWHRKHFNDLWRESSYITVFLSEKYRIKAAVNWEKIIRSGWLTILLCNYINNISNVTFPLLCFNLRIQCAHFIYIYVKCTVICWDIEITLNLAFLHSDYISTNNVTQFLVQILWYILEIFLFMMRP